MARGHSSLFFHDIGVEVAGDGAALAAFEGLASSAGRSDEQQNVRNVLRVELRHRARALDAVPSGGSIYLDTDRRLVVDHDAAQAVVDLDSHQIEFCAELESPLEPNSPAAVVFTTALKLALRELGIVALHAAAVITDGAEALVIVGDSGAGKTTTALALLECGCTPMTDDELFLRSRSSEWELLSIPQAFRATRETLAAFPSWTPHRGALLPDFAKYELHVGNAATMSGRYHGPIRLLFPRRVSTTETSLAPLTVANALGELMVASPLVALGGVDRSRRHAELLRRLATESQPMRLNLGSDLLAASKRTGERLLTLLGQSART